MVANLPADASDYDLRAAIIADFAQILYERHVLRRMQQHGITPTMVREALTDDAPEVIERYDEDLRGRSCLVLGSTHSGKPLHLCLGFESVLFLITVYDPSEDPKVRFTPPDWRYRSQQRA